MFINELAILGLCVSSVGLVLSCGMVIRAAVQRIYIDVWFGFFLAGVNILALSVDLGVVK